MKRGFTLIELALVIALIFILATSLIVTIPMVQRKAAIGQARGDVGRLQMALSLYQENERSLPPDRTTGSPDLLNVSPAFSFTPGAGVTNSPELRSNILMVHYLSTRRSRTAFIEFKTNEVAQKGTMNHNVGDSVLIAGGAVAPFNAFAFFDPWQNPYIYDNNEGDNTTNTAFEGLPNNNPDFDIYSLGPNRKSALPTVVGWQNGFDDDGQNGTDDAAEVNFNGRERVAGNEVGDDINNFIRAK